MTVALARRFIVEIASYHATVPSNWYGIAGVNDFDPELSTTTEDTTDFDTDGYMSKEKTAQGWTVTIKAFRRLGVDAQGKPKYDDAQETIRQAHDQFGTAARVWVRWYDRNGLPEAYQGLALVSSWKPSKTGVTNVAEVTIVLDGDGERTEIDNPVASS